MEVTPATALRDWWAIVGQMRTCGVDLVVRHNGPMQYMGRMCGSISSVLQEMGVTRVAIRRKARGGFSETGRYTVYFSGAMPANEGFIWAAVDPMAHVLNYARKTEPTDMFIFAWTMECVRKLCKLGWRAVWMPITWAGSWRLPPRGGAAEVSGIPVPLFAGKPTMRERTAAFEEIHDDARCGDALIVNGEDAMGLRRASAGCHCTLEIPYSATVHISPARFSCVSGATGLPYVIMHRETTRESEWMRILPPVTSWDAWVSDVKAREKAAQASARWWASLESFGETRFLRILVERAHLHVLRTNWECADLFLGIRGAD